MFDRRVPMPLNQASMEAEWQNDIVGREPRTCYWFMIDDDQGAETGMAGMINISYVHGDALMPIACWICSGGSPIIRPATIGAAKQVKAA